MLPTFKPTLLAASAALGALLLTACTSTADDAAGGMLLTEGVFKVCSDTAYPPFEFIDASNKPVGFDMDMAQEIADDLGAKLEILSSPFEGIESGEALNTKQCDATISGISINDQRKSKFDFSEQYFDDGLALLVRVDSGIKNIDGVGDARVGVQKATTGQEFAVENGISPVEYNDSTLAVQGLLTKDVDAVINNKAVLVSFSKTNPELKIADEFASEPLGIGVRKGNTELLDSINATIQRMQDSGQFDELTAKWMS